MALLVKNERTTAYIFDGSRGSRQIAPGELQVIADEEWATVIAANRGPGQINPLWPAEATSEYQQLLFDYYLVGSEYEARYIGSAEQGSDTSEPVWVIKKFAHSTFAGINNVTSLQVLTDVAWDDRATLGWAF